MKKKPPSAKSKAAKAKREKIAANDTRERVEESFDRTWKREDDVPWIEGSYPSERPLTEGDLMTAEEAQAAEEQLLGKRGVPELDDPMPDFIFTAAKAGPERKEDKEPPLDHLGRTKAEREGKIKNAIIVAENALTPTPPKDVRRVTTVMRDHDLEYPDLYMAVYVAGDWDVRDDEARFARLFARSGCYKANSIEEADLVVFGGGSDVDPSLYNETCHEKTYFNRKRDDADMEIYLKARELGTAMFGVCRGAQFLHVMNGGKLYQDVNGHYGEHRAYCLQDRLLIENVSSVHHQMVIFNKEMEVMMTTSQSSVRWLNAKDKETMAKGDIEAFYYRDTGCFGVQGHPEYAGCNKFSVWCLEKLRNLFLCSPDFEWSGKRLTMTREARDAGQIAAQYVENAYNQTREA